MLFNWIRWWVVYALCYSFSYRTKFLSSDYLIKYKINAGEEHSYDTSKLTDSTQKTEQNDKLSDNLLMVKLEIFKYLVEEYKKNGNSNGLKKWKYL